MSAEDEFKEILGREVTPTENKIFGWLLKNAIFGDPHSWAKFLLELDDEIVAILLQVLEERKQGS